MSNDSDRDTKRHNRYDRANRYEGDRQLDRAGPHSRVPEVELTLNSDAWRPRNVPASTNYQPVLGEGRRARRHAHRVVEDLHTAASIANAGAHLNQVLKGLEESHQDLEETQERRRLVPLKVEQTKLEMGREVVKGQIALEEVVDEQHDKRIDRQRERELAADDYEIVRLRKRREILEEQARIDEAAARLAYANEIRREQGEAELQKARRDTLRNEADAEAERGRRDRERRSPPTAIEDVPEELQAPLATERTVASTREWVEQRIAIIKRRAQAEGRDLTREELEQIDQYRNAADEGEASIRRRGASDL